MATYTCLWRIPFQKTNCELWWNTCIVNTKDTPQVLVEKAKHTQVNQTINTNCWNLHQCNPLSIWYFILPWLSCFHFSKLSVEIHFHISMFLDHHDKFSQCLPVYKQQTPSGQMILYISAVCNSSIQAELQDGTWMSLVKMCIVWVHRHTFSIWACASKLKFYSNDNWMPFFFEIVPSTSGGHIWTYFPAENVLWIQMPKKGASEAHGWHASNTAPWSPRPCLKGAFTLPPSITE